MAQNEKDPDITGKTGEQSGKCREASFGGCSCRLDYDMSRGKNKQRAKRSKLSIPVIIVAAVVFVAIGLLIYSYFTERISAVSMLSTKGVSDDAGYPESYVEAVI